MRTTHQRAAQALERHGRLLLWLGALAGLILAVGDLVRPGERAQASSLPAGTVAVVNGEWILKVDYELALRKIVEAAGRQNALVRDRRAALERVVDDELMIEHGLRLGLLRSDQATRYALLSAVSRAERAFADSQTPTEAELMTYYEQIRNTLVRPGRLHIRQLSVRVRSRDDRPPARARLQTAAGQLRAGVPWSRLQAELEPSDTTTLPDAPAPAELVRRELGPLAYDAALRLKPGEVSDVLGDGALLRVIQLVSREPDEIPSFEEVRDLTTARLRARAGDRAFEQRLKALRETAEIRTSVDAP